MVYVPKPVPDIGARPMGVLRHDIVSPVTQTDTRPDTQPGARTPAERVRARPMIRRYRFNWIDTKSVVHEREQPAPALAVVQAAFSAFAHGTLLTTREGPVAVEDLIPGDRLVLAQGGTSRLRWIGQMTHVPGLKASHMSGSQTEAAMIRVPAGSFGPGRPVNDLVLGQGARVVQGGLDGIARLVPVADMADGIHVIRIVPPGVVTLYHLMLERHGVMLADGLEVESYHPGPGVTSRMGREMLTLFMTLFPHIHGPHGFGPLALPRTDTPEQPGHFAGRMAV